MLCIAAAAAAAAASAGRRRRRRRRSRRFRCTTIPRCCLFNSPSLPCSFPFCTIDPNNARVVVPDPRFDWLVSALALPCRVTLLLLSPRCIASLHLLLLNAVL